ncbi:MAG TPA: CAP domain-containing protein [Mycobacteriales bacterium]
MRRSSLTSRWVVLPAALAAAALATAVTMASASPDGDRAPVAQTLTADGAPAPAATGQTAAPDRSTATTRKGRALPAPAPARRLYPTSPPRRHRPTPRPTMPGTPPAPAPTTTTPPSTPTTAPAPPVTPPGGNSSVTAQVVTLTNAERAKAGCGALTVNATLTSAAQAHSADMAAHNYFDHNSQDGRSPFDRITAAGYRFSTAAENIAAGQRTPQAVMTSWMNSPGHKANILNCALHEIGVGYATSSSSTYGVYWTQDFGTRR